MTLNTNTIEPPFHQHIFLGEEHEQSERKTWTVIWLCGIFLVETFRRLVRHRTKQVGGGFDQTSSGRYSVTRLPVSTLIRKRFVLPPSASILHCSTITNRGTFCSTNYRTSPTISTARTQMKTNSSISLWNDAFHIEDTIIHD